MGAWGTGPFANDGAVDWLGELTAGDDLEPVKEAFAAIEECADDYIEADLGDAAMAAAEVVARLLGRPGPSGSEEPDLDEWLANHAHLPVKRLAKRAVRVLALVGSEKSELRELWDEADDAGWWEAVSDLQTRLQAGPALPAARARAPRRRRAQGLSFAEGTWFAVPLRNGGWAVGVVARTTRLESRSPGLFVGYFFGPRRADMPSLADVEGLRPEDALGVFHVVDAEISRGVWPVLGVLPPWRREEWIVPIQVQLWNRDARLAYFAFYDDDDLEAEPRVEQATYDGSEGYEDDTLLSADNVAYELDVRLGGWRGPFPGTWGSNPFENAAAAVWLEELYRADGLPPVVEAFAAVEESDEKTLDETTAARAVAAADVVARLLGRPGFTSQVAEPVNDWIWPRRYDLRPDAELVKRALRVVDRVAGWQSELRDLWAAADSDKYEDWTNAMEDLRRRLRG